MDVFLFGRTHAASGGIERYWLGCNLATISAFVITFGFSMKIRLCSQCECKLLHRGDYYGQEPWGAFRPKEVKSGSEGSSITCRLEDLATHELAVAQYPDFSH